MSNVIEFKGRKLIAQSAESNKASNDQDSNGKKRDLDRLVEIEVEIQRRPRRFGPRDRLSAALFLTKLFRKLREQGITREDVEAEVDQFCQARKWRKKRGRFRLQRWTLSHDMAELTPSEVEARYHHHSKHEPQKDVAVYLAATEVLARRFLNQDAAALKIELLKSTTLWNRVFIRSGSYSSAPNDVEQNLALLVNALARHIAHITDLTSLLQRTERVPGIWEPYQEQFVNSYRGRATNLCVDTGSPVAPFGRSYDESNLPPFPSLSLVRVPYVIVDGPLWLEIAGRDLPLDHWRAREPDADCEAVDGRVVIYREIRLALAPVSSVSPGEIGAVFESRAHIEVRLDTDDDRAGRYSLLTPQSVDFSAADIPVANFSAQIDVGGWRRVMFSQNLEHWTERCSARIPDYPMCFDAEPVARPGAPDDECWYFSYTQADADHVRHWLLEDRRLEDEPAVSLWKGWKDEPVTTFAAHPRLPGRHVEAALHSNAIEEQLTQKIERLRASLEAREAAWRSAATAATEDLLARWRSAETPSSGDAER